MRDGIDETDLNTGGAALLVALLADRGQARLPTWP